MPFTQLIKKAWLFVALLSVFCSSIFALRFPIYGGYTFTNPGSIPGNFLWYTAKTGVTTSGSAVTSWADQSSNGYNLASYAGTGVTVDTSGINGTTAIKFNGADNLYKAGLGGVTRSRFSFWAIVQPTTFANENVIWWMPSAAWVGGTGNLYLEDSNTHTQALDYWLTGTGNKAIGAANSFPNGITQEISGTYDGTTANIYVNNVSKGTQSVASAFTGDSIAVGGLRPGYSGSQWSGEIAEMAFFNRSLTSVELGNLHAYGQKTWWNIWSGMTGSMTFDGTTTYLGAGAGTGNWEYTQALTLMCWVLTPSGYSTQSSLITHQRGTVDDRGFDTLLFFQGGHSYVDFGWFSTFQTSGLEFVSPDVLHTDGIHWDHVVVTLDGTGTVAGSHIYVNGANQSLTTKYDNLVTTVQDSALQLKIGDAHSTSFAKGQIGQCAIFTAALSSSDVTTIYNYGVAYNLSGYHDLAHWWYLGSDTDTTSTVYDRVGSYDMTVNGTGAITSAVPMPLLPQ